MARSPVRMPAGLQNVDYSMSPLGAAGEANYDGARNSHPLFMYPALDPVRLIVSKNDFIDLPNGFTTTVVGTGIAALAVGQGGIIQFTTNNATPATTDSVAYQEANAAFLPTAAQQMWYHVYVTPQDSTDSTFLLGITNITTTPASATDGIWFSKATATQAVSLVTSVAGTQVVTPGVATMADLTGIKLSFYYDGKGNLNYYVNNAKVGSVLFTPTSTALMAPQFYIVSGVAASKYLQCDYFLTAQEMVR